MKYLFSKFNFRMLSRTSLMLAALILLCAGSPAPERGIEPFPHLQEAIKIALERHSISNDDKSDSMSSADLVYKVRDYYYQLQSKNEQLSITKEVQEHFEKAVSKAEEKFDEGEEDISQSDITKLKLGLSGTRNDVITLDSEISQASLSLNDLLGAKLNATRPLPEPSNIKPVPFSHSTLVDFLGSLAAKLPGDCSNNSNCLADIAKGKSLELEKSFIRVGEAKERLKLAKNSRKISRALLVTEAANYDFGIGNTADLFQALIIYTRVLSGYYESIYQFNIAVADLNRLATNNKNF
jgi:outer membrane protein TolC